MFSVYLIANGENASFGATINSLSYSITTVVAYIFATGIESNVNLVSSSIAPVLADIFNAGFESTRKILYLLYVLLLLTSGVSGDVKLHW